MPYLSYAGTWRRLQQTRPAGGPAGGMGSLPADPVDVSHLYPPGAEYPDPQITGARAGVSADLLADGGAAAAGWGLGAVAVDAPIDRTPTDDHDQGAAVDPGQRSDAAADRQANAARARDQGAPRAQLYAPVPLRGYTERYTTERREIPRISAGSHAQLQLRISSEPPVDTPDSRLGWEVFRWVDRKFPQRWRRTDMRPTTAGTAPAPANSPPLPNANQYVSPFATLASGRMRNMMTPMLRRVPRPFDEEVVTDGTEGAANPHEYLSWGL